MTERKERRGVRREQSDISHDQKPCGIPRADAPDALSVSDGAVTCGSVVERDGAFFAFDTNGTLVGEYGSQREAVRAIPPESSARAKSTSVGKAATASRKPRRRAGKK
jgi:hypothetical protein